MRKGRFWRPFLSYTFFDILQRWSQYVRLDKYLASVTDYSRSEVKKLLRQERVVINGLPVADAGLKVSDDCQVLLDGQAVRSAGYRYFLMNKPDGVVSANRDRSHTTAIDLLDEDNQDQLHIAGRLDIDTTGMLLISDDGQWTHRVTAPNKQCPKTYHAELAEPLIVNAEKQLERGIYLHNEKMRCKSAKLERIDDTHVRLTIHEGKYHQVKRMFAVLGNRVTRLHRETVGSISLDDSLAPGEYRSLTREEVESFD